MNACQEQIPHTAVRTVSSYNCLEEEGKGLRKAEDTVLYILLTINHLQDINAMEFLTSSLKPGINCCGRGSKRQIQIIRHNHKQSAKLAAVQKEGDIGKFGRRGIRG